MKLQHLKNLHRREKRRITKSFIPRGILQTYTYLKYRKAFPSCFISSNSKVARQAIIGSNCLIQEAVVGANVNIGGFTTIGHQCRMGGKGQIRIGKFCSIAPECFIWSENHHSAGPSAYPFEHLQQGRNEKWEEYKADGISIGNSVWVGQRVTILAGANIGDGCIIASGAVVPKGEYPPYSLIGGVPAKVIKSRLSEDKIEQLQTNKWWEREPEEIFGELMPFLHGKDFGE